MAASVLGLALVAGAAAAQAPGPSDRSWTATPAPVYPTIPPAPPTSGSAPSTGKTLQFHRDAVPPPAPALAPAPAAVQALPPPAPVPTAVQVLPPPAPVPTAAQAPARAPTPAPAALQLTKGQPVQPKTAGPYPKLTEEGTEFRSLRELPGLEVVTRLESEGALKERMRQELLRSNQRIIWPDEVAMPKQSYAGHQAPPLTKLVEPAFVCHGRLLFEQPDFERGLWDFGVFGPLLSVGKFYLDVALLPYHAFTHPFDCYDCSAGKCLPGDPSPLYLYPPELSLTGLAAEAGAITALFFVFP
jgi:hypothetical protein